MHSVACKLNPYTRGQAFTDAPNAAHSDGGSRMIALQQYRGPSRLSKDVEADKQYVSVSSLLLKLY
jgi:hypothetical protein